VSEWGHWFGLNAFLPNDTFTCANEPRYVITLLESVSSTELKFCPISEQGCQIFLSATYQNKTKYTKWPQNAPFCHKIDKMAIKILTSSVARPSKIYPNWEFGFETMPSGITVSETLIYPNLKLCHLASLFQRLQFTQIWNYAIWHYLFQKPHRLQQPANLYVVLYNFKPRHSDELELK
jgi:hypothetical protein